MNRLFNCPKISQKRMPPTDGRTPLWFSTPKSNPMRVFVASRHSSESPLKTLAMYLPEKNIGNVRGWESFRNASAYFKKPRDLLLWPKWNPHEKLSTATISSLFTFFWCSLPLSSCLYQMDDSNKTWIMFGTIFHSWQGEKGPY